jgi:hypothetical protein
MSQLESNGMQLVDQPEARVEAKQPGRQLLAWLRIAPRKAPGNDGCHKAWAETVGQVISDLELLNRNTERDFLRIGGNLTAFIEAVKEISSELSALANAEQGQCADQLLTCALDRSMEMNARHRDRKGRLSGLRQQAGQLKQTLSGFKGTVSTFHTLGVLTRIETARLGSAGGDFGNLADDVRLLAGSIGAGVQAALETAALLIPPIESAMQNISALDEGQAKDLPSVISEVSASLAALRDMQARVQSSSVRLGIRYDEISDAFKKLIVSVQFHDITRQQVEHVIEVLRRLRSGCDQQGIAAVLALQSSQLADAGERFAASVASVDRNLGDIATHVLEMAGESRMLSGLSGDEHTSVFLQIEKGCSDVLAGLSHCAQAEASARVTSAGLVETIRRMRGSIEEIGALEIQMLRMAMNARIRATHIGASGDALGVLAATMEELATESGQRSESLADVLGSMGDAVTGLSGRDRPAPFTEGGSEDGYLEEMRMAVGGLISSNERSFARIAQIIDRGARLGEDLSAARKGFSAGVLFAEAAARAQRMLKEIGPKNRSSLSDDGVEAPGLANFAMHYTMQAERDVYEDATKAVVGAPCVPVRPESLAVHQAILDEEGTILEVNDAWRRFGDENQLRSPDAGVGMNYLRLCETAEGEDAANARRIANGIRDVLNRRIEEYSQEYACDSPIERRWFLLHVGRFQGPNGVRIIVVHGNITHRKLAEEEMRRAQDAVQTASRANRHQVARPVSDSIEMTAEALDTKNIEKLGDSELLVRSVRAEQLELPNTAEELGENVEFF